MSSAVLISPPGLTFGVTRTPVWSTTKRMSVTQRRYAVSNSSYPLYRVKLSFEFLRKTADHQELEYLVGFFNARGGDFDSFLWTDPDDNAVVAQPLGVGDGTNKLFQLLRSFGGYTEPVFDKNGAPLIYVNGVLRTLTTHYSIGTTGMVTFITAPPAGHSVTWTGSYYRRMVFTQSSAEFTKFLNTLWELKTLEMESVKP